MPGADAERLKHLVALFVANQVAKLFVDGDRRDVFAVEVLPTSYSPLVDRNKVERLFSSRTLFPEIKKARVLMGSYI